MAYDSIKCQSVILQIYLQTEFAYLCFIWSFIWINVICKTLLQHFRSQHNEYKTKFHILGQVMQLL